MRNGPISVQSAVGGSLLNSLQISVKVYLSDVMAEALDTNHYTNASEQSKDSDSSPVEPLF